MPDPNSSAGQCEPLGAASALGNASGEVARSSADSVRYEVTDGIATLALNDTATGNALSIDLMQAFGLALKQAADDDGVRVVRLLANGRHFCSGADLAWVRALAEGENELWQAGMDHLLGLLEALRALDKPVVARAHGAVVGGGAGILCYCDAVIAANDARWTFPELQLGLVPTALIAPLQSRVSPAALQRLLYEARTWDAAHAAAFGLATEIAPDDQLDALVDARCAHFAALPQEAVATTKSLLRTLDDARFGQTMAAIDPIVASAAHSKETRSRIGAIVKRN